MDRRALHLTRDGDHVVARGAGDWLVAQRWHFELAVLPHTRRTGYLAGLDR